MPEQPFTQDLQPLLSALPLFGNLKPKMMSALTEEVCFRVAAAGDVLVRQGEFTDELMVVLEGIATAYRTESDGHIENLGSSGAGDWFGEMTNLSNQPQFATVKAERGCTLLVVDAPLFKKLYTGGGSFRELLDQRYRERALAIHLRTAPLFKGQDREVLQRFAKEAKLETFESGKVLAEEGKAAEAVFLVRKGIVKEVRNFPDGPRVVSYLRDNSSFGERMLAEDKIWRSSMIAMTEVDVVRLTEQQFQELAKRDVHARTQLQKTVMALMAQEEGATTSDEQPKVDLSQTSVVDLMVGKKVVQGGEALVIDLHKCTRCNACVEACVAVHDDRVPRLSKRGIRTGDLMLTSACYNCKIPECMMGCNYGAIRRDVNGAIHFIFDNCTGCSACEVKCPYGVIRMAAILDPKDEEKEKKSFFGRMLPFLSKRSASLATAGTEPESAAAPSPAKPAKVEKKAIKCDLCAGLPFEACVYNCPCGAISRIDPNVLVGGRP